MLFGGGAEYFFSAFKNYLKKRRKIILVYETIRRLRKPTKIFREIADQAMTGKPGRNAHFSPDLRQYAFQVNSVK